MNHDVCVDVRERREAGLGRWRLWASLDVGGRKKVTHMFTRPNLPRVVTASHLRMPAPFRRLRLNRASRTFLVKRIVCFRKAAERRTVLGSTLQRLIFQMTKADVGMTNVEMI